MTFTYSHFQIQKILHTMKKRIFLALTIISLVFQSFGQSEIIPLWNTTIPNYQSSEEKEETNNSRIEWITKVQIPTLEIFLPSKQHATGQAVVICPGGGYVGLAYDWEGTDFAKWFNSKGIAAFVLKYRMPQSKSVVIGKDAPLQDAQRAVRMVRNYAEQWHVDTNQVGIMGFSAGGHLASTLGTHFDLDNFAKTDSVDKLSARPDFMVLVYPVITMDEKCTHMGSRENLIGKSPSQELIDFYSNDMQVKENTPPCFIVHASDDNGVPVENSLRMYRSLIDKGIPTEMHIYPSGGHGFSFGLGKGYLQSWNDRLYDWLQTLN